MTNPNGAKGAQTERMVAKYLRENGFPQADRRLREGRTDDQGDIDGVPFTVIQVKYVESNRYPQWVADTLRQRENAGARYCMLIRRIPHKPVEQWEASLPDPRPELPDLEAWTWSRMDLRLGVVLLDEMVGAERFAQTRRGLSNRSLTTTTLPYVVHRPGCPCAQCTESGEPPSATA